MSRTPQYQQDPVGIADAIVDRVGRRLVVALPLGLGKANSIANALYDRAAADPEISLTFLTALTLEKPAYENDLHRRFLAPVVERLFGDYPELRYAPARRRGDLPDNIRVEEFFFLAGSQLTAPQSQQDHICANYTHVIPYLLDRGVNVLAQLVAAEPADGADNRYSASCNADLTGDMLAARRGGMAHFLFAGEVNAQLPFMGGDALLAHDEFDFILSAPNDQFSLFAPPRMPVSTTEYASALHVARLVPDGGTLQIGIGSLGDAVAHCLALRHNDNRRFRQLAEAVSPVPVVSPFAELAPFESGLHGLSEMLVEGFLHLYDAGVLTREVDGHVLNAAFFLGSVDFYRRLREMDSATRARFAMRSIHFTNEVLNDTENKRRERSGARFINRAMMATLRGEVISDGLEDGRVVSGVGGQFDFAVQAFALEGARSVIVVPATRHSGGEVHSNILWAYGNTTLPRHLRDIVITEYGIADLRGRTDGEVIAAMLSVADSRFQEELLSQAQSAGKIGANYRIPDACRNNTPQRLKAALRDASGDGVLPDYPLGTEFSAVEQSLLKALALLRQESHSKWRLLRLLLRGLGTSADGWQEALERMALRRPVGAGERMSQLVLRGALADRREN